MLNNLKNLKDIQVISRDQQSKIQGGYRGCKLNSV